MTQARDNPSTGVGEIHDCWNKIGVQGDLTCAQLVRHIHCRNCPVYSAAASALLNSELPAGFLDERTVYFGQKKQEAKRGTHSMAIFRIGPEWLALPSSVLVEVADIRPIHPLPHRRGKGVLGLVNVRGELLICVSLGHLLGVTSVTSGQPEPQQLEVTYERLLVIQSDGGRLVFPVDEMHGIRRFHPNELQPVPTTIAQATQPFATAMLPWKNHAVGYLDNQLVTYALNRSLA